jgi:flavin-dependent dehydrogenase
MYSPRRTLLDAILVDAARAAGAEIREAFHVDELIWADDRVVGLRGRDSGRNAVSEFASLVVGADGKHSLVAEATSAPYRKRRPAMTMGSYSYWSGVAVDAGELHHRPGAAAAVSRRTTT